MSVPYYGDFAEDDTVLIPFNTFTSDDPAASSTITNLADGDIKVHKDGGTTEIATDGATIAINYDGVTGNHLVTIDTSAHADYATGSEYTVRIEGTTVDGGTINAWIGAFSIERAGGVIALLKLIQAAVITNAAGTDVAADIIAVKAETATIVNDTDVIDDGTSGLVKIAQDVAAILTDTGTTLENRLIAIETDTDVIDDGTSGLIKIAQDVAAILTDTGTTLENRLIAIEADTDVIDDGTSGLVKIAQDVAATLVDTNELQGLISSSKIAAQVKGMDANSLTASALNADAVTEIWAKAMTDLAAGAPSATASVFTAINYLYEAWRNKTITNGTNSEIELYKDDGTTKLCEADISDDGTDFTKGEYGAVD